MQTVSLLEVGLTRRHLFGVLLALFSITSSLAQPSSKTLDGELLKYLKAQGYAASRVHWELLRSAPTQTGVAATKYYIWVQFHSAKGKLLGEGAMRLAETDQHYEVTNYLSRHEIVQDPKSIESVFPVALCPGIRKRAGLTL